MLDHRSFQLGDEKMNCWDLIHHNPFVGSSPLDPTIASIRCATESDHFQAGFWGWRADSEQFYKAIESIEVGN